MESPAAPSRAIATASAASGPGLPIPSGWFAVATSDELAPGGVLARHYFGRELVVFRTEGGAPGVLDAYCPHLGAHLAVGGRVEGESLRCPFHAWEFATDGACRAIPYAKRIPPNARAALRASASAA